jgi:16S rRNA (guanine527-N7)-methyltransferase
VTETFHEKLRAQLASSGTSVAKTQLSQLERYYELLAKWNERINLTSLPLDGYPTHTIDRLFVEPAVASTLVDEGPIVCFDLGSGGGSPAIPLNVFRPEMRLTMVESRERKSAFLREAAREVGLKRATVVTSRFEDLHLSGLADLVTVRAVRLDGGVVSLIHRQLRPGGRLLLFGAQETPPLFKPIEYCQLPGSESYLTLLVRQ